MERIRLLLVDDERDFRIELAGTRELQPPDLGALWDL